MGLVVNTNTQSLFAQRALGKNTFNLQKSVEKLSTGFKINRAGDDAAGLSISQKMTAQIKGLDKAKQNASDGISMIQTAEGGLSVIQDNLQRIRELVVQASNGTNGADERTAIQAEITERRSTIDSIANNTEFNGNELLDGTGGSITLQTGADNGQTTAVSFAFDSNIAAADAANSINENNDGGAAGTLLSVIDVAANTATTDYERALLGLDNNIDNVSAARSTLGAKQNSLESKIEFIDVARENMSASRSRIRDVDVASESSVLVKNQILQQAASAMLSQANNAPQIALNLLP